MKLHQSISYLTKKEQEDLRHIVKTLSAALQPVLVFCFGIRMSQHLHRSCFTQKRRKEHSHAIYDLLIILHDKDSLTDSMAATVAQRMIGSSKQANMMVHHFAFVKEQLLKMNFFFTWVHRSAILLINSNNALMQLPQQQKKSVLLPVSPHYFEEVKQRLDKAKALLTQASSQFALQPYSATLAFIRASAAEIVTAFIKLGLGYDAAHLSWPAMKKLSENFSEILPQLFPCTTPEEIELYDLLTAEKPPAEISSHSLLALLNRIKTLKQKVNDYQFSNSTLLKPQQELLSS